MAQKISLVTSIVGDLEHLTSTIKDALKDEGVDLILQTKRVPSPNNTCSPNVRYKDKFCHITYKSKTIHLNVGRCIRLDHLFGVLLMSKELEIDRPIKGLYSLINGHKSLEMEIAGIMENCHYFVATDLEADLKLVTSCDGS